MLDNDTLDEANEWLVGRLEDEVEDELVFDDDNLTWANVADAMGVGEDPYSLKSRSSHCTTTSTSSRRKRDGASTSMARPTKKTKGLLTPTILEVDEDEEFDTNLSDGVEEEEKDNECYKSPSDDMNDDINLDDEDFMDEVQSWEMFLDLLDFLARIMFMYLVI